jgi:2-amino-4-hydroxy-6-hydroxymethyldihydropteridine diphosphokinase
MHQVFLSLGSNLGDRVANLNKGISLTTSLAGTVRKVSAVYETEPWGCKLKNNFYNMAAEIETPLKPQELLTQLKKIEKLCGRKPSKVRYTNRTLDMDILC